MGREANTEYFTVEILRRSKFDDGWLVEGEDGTTAWINDDRILDVDGPEPASGVTTKLELAVGYAESKGLA
jgi:hypothetical protein